MNIRATAAKIIQSVCFRGVSLTDAFDKNLVSHQKEELGSIKQLCFGTIRYWFQLQAILNLLLEKPLKIKDGDINSLICIGLFQIFHCDIPDYAVVNETVTAARHLNKLWANGLINKILRMAIENNEFLFEKIKSDLSAQYSHPHWLIEKIKCAWPDHWIEILESNNQQAPLFLRVNTQLISCEQYSELLTKNNISHQLITDLQNALKLNQACSVDQIPGFFEGLVSLQDLSGQQVLKYLDILPNQIILDACAAPGSKTTHIVEAHSDINNITAIDLYSNRLNKIKENIKRLKLSDNIITLISANAADKKTWWSGILFDRILVDAPCSATGVIRRHPDIKILRKETDIENLAAQQLNLLNSLWETLKNSGKLIYTTCSILPNENDQVIQKFLEKHPDGKIIPIENNWGIPTQYGQQVLTGDRNRDGFYYAILLKI